MASRDRERQLARERYQRQQQRRLAARAQQRKRNQVTAIVASAVVVVLAVVGVGLFVRGGDDDDTVAAAASPTPSSAPASPSASATSSATVAQCPTAAPSPVPSPSSYASPADQGIDPAEPLTATLTTNCGTLTVALDAAGAPKTVNSFVFLARKGFFDATRCHRVTTSGLFVLQCGDPTATGGGTPGYTIPLENAPKDEVYPAGTLAMARSTEPDSGGSQFFVVYKQTQLPSPGYSVFGRVTKGLDVVTDDAAAGVTGGGDDGAPARAIGLTKVSISGGGS